MAAGGGGIGEGRARDYASCSMPEVLRITEPRVLKSRVRTLYVGIDRFYLIPAAHRVFGDEADKGRT
ncbi:hypothetical protein D3C72_2299540 [compost metagenome]